MLLLACLLSGWIYEYFREKTVHCPTAGMHITLIGERLINKEFLCVCTDYFSSTPPCRQNTWGLTGSWLYLYLFKYNRNMNSWHMNKIFSQQGVLHQNRYNQKSYSRKTSEKKTLQEKKTLKYLSDLLKTRLRRWPLGTGGVRLCLRFKSEKSLFFFFLNLSDSV